MWIASLDDSWARMTMLHTQSWASEIVACTVLMHLKSLYVHLISACHAHCMVMRAPFVLVALHGVDTKHQGYERFLHISPNFSPLKANLICLSTRTSVLLRSTGVVSGFGHFPETWSYIHWGSCNKSGHNNININPDIIIIEYILLLLYNNTGYVAILVWVRFFF